VTAPTVVVVSLSLDELRALINDTVRAALAAHGTPYPTSGAVIDKRGLAHALDVSPSSIDRYAAAGVIPYVTLGPDGPRRFDLTEVRKALAVHASPSPVDVASKPTREIIPGVRRLSRRT
jgi:hypothetical protein